MLSSEATGAQTALGHPGSDNPGGQLQTVTREVGALSEEKEGRIIAKQEPDLASFFQRDNLTFIPLPAFAYNRNEGYWVGGLVSILKANAQQEIDDIFAPQYLYNRYVGQSVTMNYYGYRSETVQYHAVASYAEKVQKSIDLSYKNLGAGGGRYDCGG